MTKVRAVSLSGLTLIFMLSFLGANCKTPCQQLNAAIVVDQDLDSAITTVCSQLAANGGTPQDQQTCVAMAKAVGTTVTELQVVYTSYCSDGGPSVSPALKVKLGATAYYKAVFENARSGKVACAL